MRLIVDYHDDARALLEEFAYAFSEVEMVAGGDRF